MFPLLDMPPNVELCDIVAHYTPFVYIQVYGKAKVDRSIHSAQRERANSKNVNVHANYMRKGTGTGTRRSGACACHASWQIFPFFARRREENPAIPLTVTARRYGPINNITEC